MSLIVEEQSKARFYGVAPKSFQHRMSVPMPLGVSVTSLLLASLMLNVLLWLPDSDKEVHQNQPKEHTVANVPASIHHSTGDSPWSDVFITSWWDWYWRIFADSHFMNQHPFPYAPLHEIDPNRIILIFKENPDEKVLAVIRSIYISLRCCFLQRGGTGLAGTGQSPV